MRAVAVTSAFLLAVWHGVAATTLIGDGSWNLGARLGILGTVPMSDMEWVYADFAMTSGLARGSAMVLAGGLRGVAALGLVGAASGIALDRGRRAITGAGLAILAQLGASVVLVAIAFWYWSLEEAMFVDRWVHTFGWPVYTLGAYAPFLSLLGHVLGAAVGALGLALVVAAARGDEADQR